MATDELKDPRSHAYFDSDFLHKSFFDDEATSDIVIKFGSRSIHAHKIILRRGSKYFDDRLGEGSADADKNEIELVGDTELAAISMLRYLYNLEYLSPAFAEAADMAWFRMEVLADVYVTAHKYGLEGLKEWTAEPMRQILDPQIDLGELQLPFDLMAVLRLIWSKTSADDEYARPLLADYCAGRIDELKRDREFMEMVDVNDEFCGALGLAMRRKQ